MKQENDYLRAEVNESFGGLLSNSIALKAILSQIELVAATTRPAGALGAVPESVFRNVRLLDRSRSVPMEVPLTGLVLAVVLSGKQAPTAAAQTADWQIQ